METKIEQTYCKGNENKSKRGDVNVVNIPSKTPSVNSSFNYRLQKSSSNISRSESMWTMYSSLCNIRGSGESTMSLKSNILKASQQPTLVLLVIISIFFNFTVAQQQPVNPAGYGREDLWNTADYYKREHSLTKPYQGSGWLIPNWDFFGSTIVTNNYVRLTPDVRSQQGGLWNAVPVRMRNWEVQLQFQIHGKGKDLFGDGLIFWYTRDRMMQGPVFGSRDYFSGLAILVDTYSNHNGPHNHAHPYISSMVNNGSLHYDHDRDGTHTQLAGCETKLRNLQHDTWVSIRYENDVLQVSTDILAKNAWETCFKVEGVFLPTGYYFGVTAATGDLSDNHDIITIRTYELDLGVVQQDAARDHILPSATSFDPPRDHVEDQKSTGMSGLKIFFLSLAVILGIFAVVVVGIIVYQNHQSNSRKRFY